MLRRIVLVGLVVGFYAGLTAGPASAVNVGDPPEGGTGNTYAICNVHLNGSVPSSGNGKVGVHFACNYGGTSAAEGSVTFRVSLNAIANVGVDERCEAPESNKRRHSLYDGTFTPVFCAFTFTKAQWQSGGLFFSFFADGQWRSVRVVTLSGAVEIDSTTNPVDGTPAYPTDYFTGGQSGPAPAPPTPEGLCTRQLASPESGHAEFTVEIDNPDDGYSDEWEWDYGDGDADVGPDDENPHVHDYDVDLQPANGWTATGTITRTGDGVEWDADPVTGTCELRVDFFHPEADQAGTTGGGEETTFSDCVPSGWGFLNPIAYVEGTACVLQLLFIPTTFGDNVEEISDAWSASIGGTVTDAVSVLWTFPADLKAQYDETPAPCEGPEVPLNFDVAGMDVVPAHPLDACEDPAENAATTFRFVGNLVLFVGLAFMVARLALSAIGVKAPNEGGET